MNLSPLPGCGKPGGALRESAYSSCTIITATANELLSPIHDRMPVILPRESEDFWLDVSLHDPGLLTTLLTPYIASDMDICEVSLLVNSAANSMPEVTARLG